MADQLRWVGDRKLHLGKMKMFNCLGPYQTHYVRIFYSSVAPPLVGKTPKFSIFNGETAQRRILFEQWVFEVKSVLKSHLEVTLWEGIVLLLWEAMAKLV